MAKLTTVSWWRLATAVVLGMAGALAYAAWQFTTGATIPVSWSAVALLALVGAAGTFMALTARHKLRERPDLVEPGVAVTWLAMSRAMVLAGALALGGYGALSAISVTKLHTPFGVERLWSNASAVVAATLCVLVGLWLQRICVAARTADRSEE